jgi:DNA processing protein
MNKKTDETKYWLAISKNPKIGSIGFKQIINTKVPIKDIFKARELELKRLKLAEKLIKEIIYCQKEYDPDQIILDLEKEQISTITINDQGYPKNLKEIYDPPIIIYYKGNLSLDDLMISIVGSRKPTDYGRHVTYDLAYKLASAGITIVSGLALGLDSVAHQAALEAKGKTVAVLGCGLDKIYPSSHEKLAREIIENDGAILSEYPTGVLPLKQNFPARNRIISGLALGLIVTEAARGSGSLITARDALEQNREVFAIPGSIYNKNSYGPNNLIRMGAHLISDAQDVFDELGLIAPREITKLRNILPQNPEEEIIFEVLKDQPKHIDFIIKESKLEQNKVSSLLTMMEVGGRIKHLGGMVYRLNN